MSRWIMGAGVVALASVVGCGASAGDPVVTVVDAATREAAVTVDRPAEGTPDAGALVDAGSVPDVRSPTPVDAGAPVAMDAGSARDAGSPVDVGPADTGAPRDAGAAVDAGPSHPPGVCFEPVPETSTGPVVELDTIRFNWSMQCYRREDGSLFVFIEDTEDRMVAVRFYDFLNNGGPATGDTVDFADYRGRARPFFLSTISGIQTEPTWRYERDYLAYSGQMIVHQLQRSNPVGTRMRVEIRDLRAREVRTYTDGRCESVPNGGRMHVRSLILDLPVNDLHTDQDCVDWAGG